MGGRVWAIDEDAHLATTEEALAWPGDASPEEMRRAYDNRNAVEEERGVPRAGPAAIVGCVLHAVWGVP